jgi:hypothetical protein
MDKILKNKLNVRIGKKERNIMISNNNHKLGKIYEKLKNSEGFKYLCFNEFKKEKNLDFITSLNTNIDDDCVREQKYL